jgi:hypothetical protein
MVLLPITSPNGRLLSAVFALRIKLVPTVVSCTKIDPLVVPVISRLPEMLAYPIEIPPAVSPG